jgi:hypothetical protein
MFNRHRQNGGPSSFTGPTSDPIDSAKGLRSFRPLLIVVGVSSLALQIPRRARSHDGLRQVYRPGRGVSSRARNWICRSDHAGRGPSGTIGHDLVVQLLTVGFVEYVGFVVH